VKVLDYGVVETPPRAAQSVKLPMIAEDFSTLLDRYRPVICGMEKLFFATNRTTAIAVAESRGVLSYLLATRGIELREYTPSEVKKAIAGNGRADKSQMKSAVGFLLGFDASCVRDDAADALAIAVMTALSDRGIMRA
jgi:crossover junction endodeoxyribonuclease RuvC